MERTPLEGPESAAKLGDSLDPERTRAMLERFYDAMAAEVELAGGTVEKFAGDAVMAVLGARASLEDHAERALHGALAMLRRLREPFGSELALRIGVNTGEVVVGTPREGSSFVTGARSTWRRDSSRAPSRERSLPVSGPSRPRARPRRAGN